MDLKSRQSQKPGDRIDRLASDLKTHPNLKYCELSPEQLESKLLKCHAYLMGPDSMLLGYIYQRLVEKKND